MSRTAQITRETKEPKISLSMNMDGGTIQVDTGIGFFDHMLTAMAFYAKIGLEVTARGDLHVDAHHTVEDVGIVFGQALKQALGDKVGIRRFSSAFIPMDDALCQTALDFSNRPYLYFDALMPQERIGEYESCLTEEFMRAFAMSSATTLHMRALYGRNAHHITEALFKSLGVCIQDAAQIIGNCVTSTKGVL